MSASKKESPSQNELARRAALGHVQHLKSFGQALTKAAETYVTEHNASEAASDWRDDFRRNLGEANKEFHRSLAAESKKVADVYFGEAEPVVEGTKHSTTKKSTSEN
jgi:hypothetical protein